MDEEEAMYRRQIAEREKTLGSDHPGTLTSANNLALALYRLGKFKEAEEADRRALEGRERVTWEEDPDTLAR